MKKQLSIFLILVLLTGCGSVEIGNMKTDYDEYVNLGTYKHIIEIDEKDREFTDKNAHEALEEYLNIYNQNNINQDNGIMEEGQEVYVTCKINNKTEEKNIILGKDEIAPGIDEMLIGKKTGFIANTKTEDGDLQIITNYIVEKAKYDEVTDEFVKELSGGSFETVDDYVSYYCGIYAEDKKVNYGRTVLYQIVNSAQYRNIDTFIKQEYKRLYNDLKSEYTARGIAEKDIYKEYGVESEKLFKESLNSIATFNVKQCLVLYKLADLFEIEITQDDINSYIATYGEQQEGYKAENLEEYVLYRHILIKLYEVQL